MNSKIYCKMNYGCYSDQVAKNENEKSFCCKQICQSNERKSDYEHKTIQMIIKYKHKIIRIKKTKMSTQQISRYEALCYDYKPFTH